MNVPVHLRRRPVAGRATALLLPGGDAEGVLRLCAGLGLDPSGRIFAVDGGLVLKLDAPARGPVAGAVRLRRLADDLLIPADADLVPALLDDEADGLVRDRGLVFAPWGVVLAFDPRAPLAPSTLLEAEARPRRAWCPLPEPERLAERIEEIVLVVPEESPEEVLESGGEEIGVDPPRPDDAGAGSRLRGGAGRGLVWLGRTLGLPRLAELGAGWMASARGWVARPGESVLGRQAEALRGLLREFREGDVERALRHALPLGEPGGARGGTVEAGDHLPAQSLAYSLGELLGTPGRKPPGVWVGGQDLLAELSREYRKAAEQAQRRGDYRRAAVIYGKLLRDYRMAAHTLMRGGLHRDAAILLLNRLDDPRGAARAFEAAGEVDRALALYRRVGDHEAAGDLLRRIGEDDAALAEYRLAADRLVASGAGHLVAGRLLARKAARADLALAVYLEGWARRPRPNDLACAKEALALLAEGGAPREVVGLVDEAGDYLDERGTLSDVSGFYNFVAEIAELQEPASMRDELRDRAMLGLASRLRRACRPGVVPHGALADLFGRPGTWPAAVLSDADFAAKAAARPVAAPDDSPALLGSVGRIRVGVGVVSAVASAPETGDVFLGFEGGEVYAFRPEGSEVIRIAAYDVPVAALATGPDGDSVVVLRSGGRERGTLSAYARSPDGSYRLLHGMTVDGLSAPWLTPLLAVGEHELVGLWDGHDLYLLSVGSLTSWGGLSLPRPDASPPAALLVPRGDESDSKLAVLIHDGREWTLNEPSGQARHGTGLGWRPCLPPSSPLRSVTLSWARGDPDHLELAGLGAFGTLHWATLRAEEGRLDLVASNNEARAGGYLAAALVRPGLVAAVTGKHVEWLRCGADRFSLARTTEAPLLSAVACVASRRTGELIIVCRDGFVSRVRIPV